MHRPTVSLAPRAWANADKLRSSLVPVQLEVTLVPLPTTPWFISWCLCIRGATARGVPGGDAGARGSVDEEEVERGRKEGGKAWAKGLRMGRGRAGLPLLHESSSSQNH